MARMWRPAILPFNFIMFDEMNKYDFVGHFNILCISSIKKTFSKKFYIENKFACPE